MTNDVTSETLKDQSEVKGPPKSPPKQIKDEAATEENAPSWRRQNAARQQTKVETTPKLSSNSFSELKFPCIGNFILLITDYISAINKPYVKLTGNRNNSTDTANENDVILRRTNSFQNDPA